MLEIYGFLENLGNLSSRDPYFMLTHLFMWEIFKENSKKKKNSGSFHWKSEYTCLPLFPKKILMWNVTTNYLLSNYYGVIRLII